MKKISILMLDNNKDFLKVAKEFLQTHEFIGEVHTTSSEFAALKTCEEKQPQIILLDILMPGKNGIEMIPRIREKAPNAKIIMLTLWNMDQYKESALNAGADGFVSKKTMDEDLIPIIKTSLIGHKKEGKFD
ncbi:MAG: response regulator transcription factor [Desulfobacterales bacterium]|nr:response regulator transcription factor [Desulfobacterales bacterium]